MKCENAKTYIRYFTSVIILCAAPMVAKAQSLGYLAAKPSGVIIAQNKSVEPIQPAPVAIFVVPQVNTQIDTQPAVIAPLPSVVSEPQIVNLPTQRSLHGPLRSRQQAQNQHSDIVRLERQRQSQPENRGPIEAIYQDSKVALFRGVPNGIARNLPWVNYGNRNEPFDSVLARVSADLQSAVSSDPEWAIPAQNEIRRLAVQLDRLPSPTNPIAYAQVNQSNAEHAAPNRPFKPRPIWPGAAANAEEQVRPTTLTTTGVDEQGGATSGANLIWQDLEPTEQTPPTLARPRVRPH